MRAINNKDRIDIEALRKRYPSTFGRSRPGWQRRVRVFFVLFALMGVVWYGKLGGHSRLTVRAIVTVTGSSDGYIVATDPDNAIRSGVYPFEGSGDFEDGGPETVLITFAGTSIMICDEAIFNVRESRADHRFWENLDLLIIPSADEETILAMRNLFRARLIAVAPPCAIPSTQNIICETADENGKFTYNFQVKRGRLQYVSDS
ncbi:MAG: hypothetical protein LBU70_09715 [Chitinispirillales bacterium]|jgi:hypothetical protein|nr:hypothetical protein [Chitinispirillales bacterium]